MSIDLFFSIHHHTSVHLVDFNKKRKLEKEFKLLVAFVCCLMNYIFCFPAKTFRDKQHETVWSLFPSRLSADNVLSRKEK